MASVGSIDGIILCPFKDETEIALSVFAHAHATNVVRSVDAKYGIPFTVGDVNCTNGEKARIMFASCSHESTAHRTNSTFIASVLAAEFNPLYVVLAGTCVATNLSRLSPGDLLVCDKSTNIDGGDQYKIADALKQTLNEITRWMDKPYEEMREWCTARPPTWEKQWKWLLRRMTSGESGTEEWTLPSDVELEKNCPSWRSVCKYLIENKLVDVPEKDKKQFQGHPLYSLSRAKLTEDGKKSLSRIGDTPNKRKSMRMGHSSTPRAVVGHVTSGCHLQTLNKENIKKLLFAKEKVVPESTFGVDAETCDFYASMSVMFPELEFFSVKGVCDYLSNLENEDFYLYAVQLAAAFALWFLQQHFGAKRKGNHGEKSVDFLFSTQDLLECEEALANVSDHLTGRLVMSEEAGGEKEEPPILEELVNIEGKDDDETDDSYDEEDESQFHFEGSSGDLENLKKRATTTLQSGAAKKNNKSRSKPRTKSAPPNEIPKERKFKEKSPRKAETNEVPNETHNDNSSGNGEKKKKSKSKKTEGSASPPTQEKKKEKKDKKSRSSSSPAAKK